MPPIVQTGHVPLDDDMGLVDPWVRIQARIDHYLPNPIIVGSLHHPEANRF
jgi:hypothetical protein